MGERLRLRLTKMIYGGEALGRHEGKVVFVSQAIAGEEVVAEIVEGKRQWARARVLEVLTPSPHRVTPRCSHYGVCGGCHWQHIDYQAQLDYKRQIIQEQLARLGGLPDITVKPTIPSPSPWNYRNHIRFTLNEEGDLCFQAARSHRLVPIEECYLLHPLLEDILVALEMPSAEEVPLPFRRLSLRAGVHTGDRMLIFEAKEEQAPELEVELPLSCVLLTARGVPLVLIGDGHITEVVAGREYRISAPSFFQANTEGAEALVEVVKAYLALEGDETLLDAYCGVGLLGLSLADRASRVIGIEENPFAVDDARFNARDLPNVEFIEGRVEDVMPSLEGVKATILDPPRIGLHPRALSALIELSPSTIVYVSCNPSTLARDLKGLVAAGYEVVEVQPVDLFPQTYHIESVALLVKGDGQG